MCLLLHADYKLLLWPMCFELSMQAYYFSWRVVFFTAHVFFFYRLDSGCRAFPICNE